jgi:membrane protein YdbS with pleckstrin-like domain
MNYIRQKIIDTYSRGGEEIPHSKYAVVPRFMIFILYLLLIEVIYWGFPDTMWKFVENFTGGFILLTVTLFVAFVIRPVISLYNSYHEIAEDNLISVQGFASFSRREFLCPFIFINGIEVRQNLFDRLTDMGNILIGTSMTGNVEIVLRHIERPQYYANQLEKAITHALED